MSKMVGGWVPTREIMVHTQCHALSLTLFFFLFFLFRQISYCIKSHTKGVTYTRPNQSMDMYMYVCIV